MKQQITTLIDNLKKVFNNYSNDTDNAIQLLNDIYQFSKKDENENIKSFQILFDEHNKLVRTDILWTTLFDIAEYHSYPTDISIINLIDMILHFYHSYINAESISEIYSDCKALINSTLPIENQLNMIIVSKKFYLLNYLSHIIMVNLINQEEIKYKFFQRIPLDDDSFGSETNKFREKYYDIDKDTHDFAENFFSSSLCLNANFNFFLKITYNEQLEVKYRNREKDIYRRIYRDTNQNVFNYNNKNTAKFIVKMYDEDNKDIIIPFFPLGTLTSILDNDNSYVKLNITDKIVIMLEILQALEDLHLNNLFHGNLWNQSVYLNSDKDAYLGFFSYKRNNEFNDSKTKGPLYYRSPEKFVKNDNPDDFESFEKYIKFEQLSDIFSFGVLMHAILTEVKPENRMGNSSRDLRVQIVQGDYSQFLLSGINNECFKDESMKGFRDIIIDCMKSADLRYQKITEIEQKIKELPIYDQYKEEIEYRIEHAVKSSDYQCSIINVIESYYKGKQTIGYIEKIISDYMNETQMIHNEVDVIQKVLDIFEIKRRRIPLFTNVYDFFIGTYLDKLKNTNDIVINASNSLLMLSLDSINKDSMKYVSPISSLRNFKNYVNKKHSLLFIYFIAKELNCIHSMNLCHNEISYDSIGVYFNNATKSFVPSLILYYYFYYCKSNGKHPNFIKSGYSDIGIIRKGQSRDIKAFIKLISDFDGKSTALLNQLKKFKDMNSILYFIYNYMMKNWVIDQEKFIIRSIRNYDYSNFQLNYDSLYEIQKYFESIPKDQLKIQRINTDIDIEFILASIIKFINNTIANFFDPIKENIPEIKIRINPILHIDSFDEMIKKIVELEQNLFEEINKIITVTEENNLVTFTISNGSIQHAPYPIYETGIKKLVYKDFQTKKRRRKKQNRLWFYKLLIRNLDISDLSLGSVELLITRFLMGLNPKLNFKVVMRILNKPFSSRQDKNFTADDIIKIVKRLKYGDTNDTKVRITCEDGNVIVLIQNKERADLNKTDQISTNKNDKK